MGMDVTGNSGCSFRNSWWWWRPLARYCFDVAPKICNGSNHHANWQTNDGSMTETEATALGQALQVEIDRGNTGDFAFKYMLAIDALPDEPCPICEGTGKRHEERTEDGMVIAGSIAEAPWECNGCDGEGVRRPSATLYPFSVDNVQEFANFLRASGGFNLS